MRGEGFNLANFTVLIRSPEEPIPTAAYPWGESDNRVLSQLPGIMDHVVEVIANLLPEGYSVEILELSGE